MSKFNPEDFKAPVMEPLSTVTIFDETIEWDKSANGVVAAYGDGSMHIVDGEAYYEQPRGEYGEGSVRIDLVIENDNIDTNMLACSVEARRLVYLELLEECGGNEMKATYMLLKHYAKSKDISVVPNAHTAFMNILNPESRRLIDVGVFQMKTPNPDYVLPEVHSEAGKIILSRPKTRPYGQSGLSMDVKTAMMGMLDERNPAGKITEIDPDIFSMPMTGGFAEDKPLICAEQNLDVDLNKMNGSRMQMVGKISDLSGAKAECGSRIQMNARKITVPSGAKAECGSRMQMAGRQPVYCRECSCKSCGAPVSFYRVDTKTFEEAKYKGKTPRNFTDAELESIFGDFGEIDGVIYDDTRLCSTCSSYDY